MNPFNELKQVKTLLVDDDELIRDSLSIAFKNKGCFIRAAESAEEGLKAIKEEQFDIIITHPNAVHILITAYRDEYMFSEAVRLGVAEFIQKPFSVKALVALLAVSLKRQTNKQLAASSE